MVSAGAANKKAFGIDRADQSRGPTWSAPTSSGSPARTSPSARRSRRTTSGRRASTARRSSSRIRASRRSRAPAICSCRSSPAATRRSSPACCNLMIEHDWLDHDIHRRDTPSASSRSPSTASEWTPARTAEVTGVPERGAPPGGRVVGHGEDELPLARPRHRASLERRAERARHDQPRARVRPDRQAEVRLRHDHRPGQRPGRPRARPEVRPASRAGATSATPSIARYIAGVWGIDERDLPGPGVDAYEMFRKIDAGEIKGLLSICFNPMVSLPDNTFVTRCSRSSSSSSRSTSS